MASEKDRLEDIRQLLNGTAEGQEEQLAELLQDSDAMDDVRATVCLRQALLRRHSQDIMPQAEVSKELSKFRSRMGMKSQPMDKKQPETGRVATEQQCVGRKDAQPRAQQPSMAAQKPVFSRPLLWGLIAVAACLLLLFGATWWFQAHQPEENPDIAFDVPRHQLTEPSIVTSKGKIIPLTNTCQNISMSGSNLSARNRLLRALGYDADEVSTEKCSIAVPPGKSYDIVLADGTKVWLYADSKLTYPLVFNGKERAVYLQGQAEFDVTHDPSHPFVVITDKMDARVLGTEINVSCYPKEAAHVALLRGVVVVSGRNGEHAVTLRPGQGATMMGTGMFSVAEENMDPYEYWKNGYLYFDDQPLETIAKALSRWYRVQFVFENPSLEKKRLRFFCLRSEDLSRALELLNHFSGIEAKQQADGVHIK
jgi:ferric-dicitrate binding protein FerR (iron transport regulator)